MKVYTRIVTDYDGRIIESEFYEYDGLVALCDRAAQAAAVQARKTAEQQAAIYGQGAQGIQAAIVPRLEREAAEGGPGYGAFGLGAMESEAAQAAAGATGATKEEMRLRAMRTGNVAGLGAGEAAAAGEAAKAGGSALQQILAKNAELKAQQREVAGKELSGILGEDIRGQAEQAGLIPEDIKAQIEAGQSGWLQNTLGVMDTLAKMGSSAADVKKAFFPSKGG